MRTGTVKAAVVNGWDVRPTLEWIVASSSGRIVRNRLITTPGPDPAPPAAYLRASTEHAGHPVAASTAASGGRLGGGPVHDDTLHRSSVPRNRSVSAWPRRILARTLEVCHCTRTLARIKAVRRVRGSTKPTGASMSLSLVEALGQVNLEAGRVYRCQVKGHWVELRVLGPTEVPPVSVYDESDVMLDPWVEFPRPTSMFSVTGKFGPTPLPDVPEIPDDGDGE